MYTPNYIAQICEGEVIGSAHVLIKHLITDSRTLTAFNESCFFAIVTARNNGHNYIEVMYDKGVRCFIISDKTYIKYKDAAYILVNDALIALQLLATHHKNLYPIPTLAITGSNGKTIVKEWLYQILKNRFNICRSPKSYNSQIGVPHSVWNVNSHHNLGLFEAGISLPGEMEKIAPIIQPTIGVFTGIGAAHQEGFKSIEEKIQEKFKLFSSCEQVIINGLRSEQISHFIQNKHAIIIGEDVKLKNQFVYDNHTELEITIEKNSYKFQIPFVDVASINNALTCVGVLVALKLNIEDYLPKFSQLIPVALRLEIKTGINNCVLINDYYNSDLDSLQIALNHLNQHARGNSRTVILSEIEQSGLSDKDLYRQIANLLKQNQVTRLVAIGKSIAVYKSFFSGDSYYFDTTSDLLKAIKEGRIYFQNTTLLLKGARSFGFEQISQLLQQKSHDTVLEINLNKLTDNINYYKSLISKETKIMCMVKAMGYGSGSAEIARTMQHLGIQYLAVAYADEGVELRNANIQIPIMVMSPEQDSMEDLINFNLEPEIYSFRILEMFCRELNKSGISEPYPIHLKIDTGMHRLGFEEMEIEKLVHEILTNPQVKVKSVFSHLVGSDNPELDEFSQLQIQIFNRVCSVLESKLTYKFDKHICNSGGISRFKNAHFDMVRLGIGMYGIGVNAEEQKLLQNVSRLKTRISQIKQVKKGDSVSYNRSGMIYENKTIATIPIGYADGFKRELGNGNFELLVRGKACKTVGNICMDMCMIDVTGLNCIEGDEVIIFETHQQIQKLSDAMQTIPYEVLTSISNRVKRVYLQE